MTQEKILEKLGKIKAHMESAKEIGNEEEAQAFAAMLQNLLLKHKLEMTDVQYAREMQDEPIVEQRPETVWEADDEKRVRSVSELAHMTWKELPRKVKAYIRENMFGDDVQEWSARYDKGDQETREEMLYRDLGVGMRDFPSEKWYSSSAGRRVYKNYPDVEVVNRRRGWSEELASIVADAYSSRILVTPGRSYITFVGHKSNVAIAEYLYITMLRAAEKLSDKAAKTFRANHRAEHGVGATPAGYRESWLDGFTLRIAQRLKEERAKFETPSTETALVRVNKEAIAVRSYMDKFKKTASSLGGMNNFNQNGYADGKRAADAMNLSSNAVRAGQSNKQLN